MCVKIVNVYDGAWKDPSISFYGYPWIKTNPFCRCVRALPPRDTTVQVKRGDMSSMVFGWVDFFVFVLLTFALGFATNAKMYALLLGKIWSRERERLQPGITTCRCQRGCNVKLL
jgi:hypothetical protein